MKKKEYVTPNMEVVEIKTMALLAGSGVTSDNIDFGGDDPGGNLDPASPELQDLGEMLGISSEY